MTEISFVRTLDEELTPVWDSVEVSEDDAETVRKAALASNISMRYTISPTTVNALITSGEPRNREERRKKAHKLRTKRRR